MAIVEEFSIEKVLIDKRRCCMITNHSASVANAATAAAAASVSAAQIEPSQLEALIAKATAEALKELASDDSRGMHVAVQNATRKVLREQLDGKQPEKRPDDKFAHSIGTATSTHNIHDLLPCRMKLLRCDDELCEYEDIDDGQIKVSPITKKVVKLKWENPPSNVLIVKKPHDATSNSMFEDLVPWLQTRGVTIVVEPHMLAEASSKFPYLRTWNASEAAELCRKIHFIICIGGDGTLLWSQSLFQSCNVPPIISFSAGSLGFLTTFDFGNHRTIISSFMSNGGFLTLRMRLQCQIVRSGQTVPEQKQMTAMNEVLIDRGPSPYLTSLECYCDGVFTTTVQADGLIIATPTGSTAYSLAAGGSMVHPLVPSILFTPVCPHSLSFRPLIFPDSANLKVKVPVGSRCTVWLTSDGRSRVELQPNDSVIVRMSEWPVPVVCRTDETSDWFGSVIQILHWNERKQQKPQL